MWNRLKNSLTAAAISTALVLGLATLAQPLDASAAREAQLAAAPSQEQAAYRLGVQLAVLAIDAAIREATATAPTTAAVNDAAQADGDSERAEPTAARSHSRRTPFYSFGSRTARVQGS